MIRRYKAAYKAARWGWSNADLRRLCFIQTKRGKVMIYRINEKSQKVKSIEKEISELKNKR